MRSTIHAVCCGTNLTIVFAGSRGFWKYVGNGPAPDNDDGLELMVGRNELEEEVKSRVARRICWGWSRLGVVRNAALAVAAVMLAAAFRLSCEDMLSSPVGSKQNGRSIV
jgi:hypothetical protein